MTVKVISNALSIKLGIVFNDNNMDFFVISELTPSPLDNADTVEDFSFKSFTISLIIVFAFVSFFLNSRIITNNNIIIFAKIFTQYYCVKITN